MLLQAGKASSPEGVEAAELQGLGIAGMLLDSPAQWTNLRYDSSPFSSMASTVAKLCLQKMSLCVKAPVPISGKGQLWCQRFAVLLTHTFQHTMLDLHAMLSWSVQHCQSKHSSGLYCLHSLSALAYPSTGHE